MSEPGYEINNPLSDFSFGDPFKTWWPFIAAVVVGILTTIRGYLGGPTCPSDATLHGRTVVVTGGSSGIGLELVVELVLRGAKVIVGARDVTTAQNNLRAALKQKKITTTTLLVVHHLDLSLLRSVREFVNKLEEEPKIDILINNGGTSFNPYQLTEEGFEVHLVTNYLSHFLLTHLLLSKLEKAQGARVINVSAQAHYLGHIHLDDLNLQVEFSSNKAYAQSKLALVLMTRHMSTMLAGKNITINAMHPGIVRGTNHLKQSVLRHSQMLRLAVIPWEWLLMKNPKQGAQTIIYMAVEPSLSNTSGKYFSNCAETEPSEKVLDETLSDKLYRKSLDLTELQQWEAAGLETSEL